MIKYIDVLLYSSITIVFVLIIRILSLFPISKTCFRFQLVLLFMIASRIYLTSFYLFAPSNILLADLAILIFACLPVFMLWQELNILFNNYSTDKVNQHNQMASIGEMTLHLVHEINTPLTIIFSSLSCAKSRLSSLGIIDEYTDHHLEKMKKTLNKVTSIIYSLKNVSHYPLKQDFSLCLIKDILDDVLTLCSERMKENRIKLTIVKNEGLNNEKYACSRAQISQVFMNLISNAIDAVEDEKQGDKWIRIEAYSNEDEFNFKVSNSGKGLTEEVSKKMFFPFFTTKSIGKGNGIGLSLTKSIIERHKGKINIEKFKPTTFNITLPKISSAS